MNCVRCVWASKEDFVIAFNLTMKGVLVGERRVIYFKDSHWTPSKS
jgi:hypothetical protein